MSMKRRRACSRKRMTQRTFLCPRRDAGVGRPRQPSIASRLARLLRPAGSTGESDPAVNDRREHRQTIA